MTFTKWAPWSCYGPEIKDTGELEIAVVPARTEGHFDEADFYKPEHYEGERSSPSYASKKRRPFGAPLKMKAPMLDEPAEIVSLDNLSAIEGLEEQFVQPYLSHGDPFSPFFLSKDDTQVSPRSTASNGGSSRGTSSRRGRARSGDSRATTGTSSRRGRAWSGESRGTTGGFSHEDTPKFFSESERELGPAVRRSQSDFVGGPNGHLGGAVLMQLSNPLGYSSAPLDFPRTGSEPLRMTSDARVKSERNTRLDTLLAIGDVIAVRGNDRLSRIGASGGFMGHVLVVTAPPKGIHRDSAEGLEFQKIWPERSTTIVWQIAALESIRGHATGLHDIELLCYVEEPSGKVCLLGEISEQDVILKYEHDVPEILEFWQCPQELRAANRSDLMDQVLSEMKTQQASWSWSTAVRAFLLPPGLITNNSTIAPSIQEIQDCWKAEPICTSVVIAFWQRYLCKLAERGFPFTNMTAFDMILQWMPLKADRVLPGELLNTLRLCKWGHIERLHIPKLKHLSERHQRQKDDQYLSDSWLGRTHL